MLYHITKVSLRPLAFASRVLKSSSTSSTAQLAAKRLLPVASGRCYASATASKTRAAAKSTTASKAAKTKKATATKAKKPAAKKKPTKKPVTKAKKKKPVVKKPVKKASRPRLTKKVLEEREKEKLKALKEATLLTVEPKRITTSSAWITYLNELRASGQASEELNSVAKMQALSTEASKAYKSLPPAEIERLNHKAQQKRREQEAAYKKWLSSYTPDQIRQANSARRTLQMRENKKAAAAGKKPTRKYPLIQDDRQPKRATGAFALFCKDRWASGDLKTIPVTDASKLLGTEWKALGENAKKQYLDKARADQLRAEQEKQTVFQ